MTDRITQKYLRRWPDSKRSKSWAGRLVHIQTENGVWRINGKGYTYERKDDAWVLPFEEAQKEVAHCGPEKQATFILARRPAAPVEGLETVRFQFFSDADWLETFFPDDKERDGFQVRELVTRSQSEAIIAAKDAQIDKLEHAMTEKRRDRIGDSEKGGAYLCRAEKAEADNAALTARVKELTEALEFISGIGFVAAKDAPAHHDETVNVARASLEAKP